MYFSLASFSIKKKKKNEYLILYRKEKLKITKSDNEARYKKKWKKISV